MRLHGNIRVRLWWNDLVRELASAACGDGLRYRLAFGRCEEKTGIAPVDRLIGEVMSREPYQSARRVFWIMDNCSAHRRQKAVDRLRSQWPNVVLVHTPVHASWLNQIEIYFSKEARAQGWDRLSNGD
jgi:DDE superfamily endonuclease